ncbi:MAG: N-acetyltransferase [Planctomycetes bacterium]|jgi:acetyltransferase-like isoleucine patch superfamily enzyme|nr:N-acetyltransferase [Planctomycetota bacterium]MDP6424223.1 acyltransferase [Planctomycetota bacterium]
MTPPWIHDTAILEQDVQIGDATTVWSDVHIRHGAVIGEQCIVGEKTYIAYDVLIGRRCKINAFVYICNGVTLEDGVMIGAHTTFTNDRFPRAATWDLSELLPSVPTEHTMFTFVKRGAALGAGVCVAPGITIGEWATVGMASVVTDDVAPHMLVAGNPARRLGYVCRCGWRVATFVHGPELDLKEQGVPCGNCGATLRWSAAGKLECDASE